jgi:hypothetical protein
MKRKTVSVLIALLCAFSLMLTGCGKSEQAPETTAAAAEAAPPEEASLGLSGWELDSSTWSSPNGATVHITATPVSYAEGMSASFVVRLEGADVTTVPCQWDGSAFTASAELNAEDGYCYYMVLTGADGQQAETPVNIATEPVDETLVNMATALSTYCTLLVEESEAAENKLTITAATVRIQPPTIKNGGQAVTCTDAVLVLTFNGEEVGRKALDLPAADDSGAYEFSVNGISFDIPELEDDNQLNLRLDVTLSNGHTLSDANGSWAYMDGQLLGIVG